MAVTERPLVSLQENLITLLGHSEEHGKLVATLADPSLFEGEYRIFAERFIGYWKEHNKPPDYHVADLVADILEDPNNRKAGTYRRIIASMLELSENMNTGYVLDQLHQFNRMQKMKSVILRSAETINAQQQLAIPQIEAMFHDILHTTQETTDPGTQGSDVGSLLDYLQGYQADEFLTGIPELDRRHITPARGTLVLLLGATGLGKSWFLINIGKHALAQRKKVLHVTLELSAEETHKRYWQNLLAVPAWQSDLQSWCTTLRLNKDYELIGFGRDKISAEYSMQQPKANKLREFNKR